MPKYKDASIGVCVILAMLFIAFGLIMISIGRQFSIGETNWYLPAGLFLTAAANFANLHRVKKIKVRWHRMQILIEEMLPYRGLALVALVRLNKNSRIVGRKKYYRLSFVLELL